MNSDCELSFDELDTVVGGSGSTSNVGDFTYCPPGGSKPEGLYAPGTDCGGGGNPLINAFLQGFKNGGGTFPGGSPA
jgi:hypothetical protein